MEYRIFGLDFLRAVAISMVLLANCIYVFPIQDPVVGQLASLSGFFGLEIFFVLSGFFLFKSIHPIFINEDIALKNLLRFIKLRLSCIWPLYLLALLINSGIAFFMDYPVVHWWKYFIFLQNFSGPIPDFFPESWGLPVIVFSMLIFPFCLMFVFKIFKWDKPILFLVTIISLLGIFLASKWIYNETTFNTDIMQWNVSLKTVLIYRLDSVFIGVLFGWMHCYKTAVWKRVKVLALLGFLGLAFISVGVGYFQITIENHQVFWNIFYLPLTSVSIALLLPFLSDWRNSILSKPITYLSTISYAVFLVHFSIVLQLMEHFLLATFTSNNLLLLFVVFYMMATLFIGAALHHIAKNIIPNMIKK